VRRSKYGAVPTVVDGIRFASKKEARRYQELRLLERCGDIWDLEVQPKFVLSVHSACPPTSGFFSIQIGFYVGDFKYCEAETTPYVVEDVKGVKTALYKWKKRHTEAQYGISIREV